MATVTTYNNNNVNENAQLLRHVFAFTDSLAIRTAIELQIAEIIHSNDHPMTLPQIASKMESKSPDVMSLGRVMRVLACKKIFTINYDQEDQPLYGPTSTSNRLRRDHELSVAPMFMTFTDPTMIAPWNEIGRSIKDGGGPFERAHGETVWEKGSKEPEFNELFNSGMASVTKTMLSDIVNGYKDGLSKLEGTLVDVGGGIGKAVSAIVKAHPHITGINFDLPHVVSTAPSYVGVTHVGGDMFKDIPKADTVLLKSVLHDWGDEDCIKILKNCQKIVSEKNGKVIIVDIVLQSEGDDIFDDSRFACDLLMMALCVGGKERTQNEWKMLLKQAGFARYNFISIPALVSIIEAFPN